MSKSIYEETLDLIENIDRNLPYTWLFGRDSLMKIKQTLEKAQKQEKLLQLYREKDKYTELFAILPNDELDKYRNIVKQIKEEENEV